MLTALAFAGDDGSGMAGLVLFVTGPLFLVAFLMAAPAALFLVLNEPHSERLNSFHDILNASNGR